MIPSYNTGLENGSHFAVVTTLLLWVTTSAEPLKAPNLPALMIHEPGSL